MSTISYIILASASPRRRALIQRFGLPVTIRPANIDEDALTAAYCHPAHPQGPPEALAERLATAKARHIAQALMAEGQADGDAVVLGSDTTVILDGTLLGKPRDGDEARAMLTQLRGRTHTVVTGLAALVPVPAGRLITHAVATPVTMRAFSDAEMEAYIATGDPFDKAGSYAIQHPLFQPVAHIAGCATGVIGLPLCAVALALRQLGVAVTLPPLEPGQLCRWDLRCTTAPEDDASA